MYSAACSLPKIFWYLNFSENVLMTAANGLFRTFCHSSCFPLLRSQTLGCSKTSKKFTSPFLACFHRTAACQTPGAVGEEGAEEPPHLPGLRLCPCPRVHEVQGSMERERHHLSSNAPPLQCNLMTLSLPIQFIVSIKVNAAMLVLYLNQIWQY